MNVQDAAVAAVAIAGAAMLVGRIVRSMKPSDSGACPSCASGASACAKPANVTETRSEQPVR